MKNTFILILLLFLSFTLKSQLKIELKPEIGFGLLFNTYTEDSLVPPNRTNGINIGTTSFVNIHLNFQTKDYRWLFSVGSGLTHNMMVIRENNGFDRLIDQSLFFLGTGGNLPIKDIKVKYQNINLPVSIAYNLNKRFPEKSQCFFGFQINSQLNIGKQVEVNAPSYSLSETETEQIKKSYKERIEPFVIAFVPHFEFRSQLKKNIRSSLIITPYAFYNRSQMKNIVIKPGAMQLSYALVFLLK